jgi:ABC-type branched-subunit amino acid transport system substrate-binding protein
MTSEIKLGFLMDFEVERTSRYSVVDDYLDALTLTFEEAVESGLLDRPVNVIRRIVEGLPKGDVHTVIEAVKELKAEGCLAVIGPWVSDNAVALHEYNETEGHLPMLGCIGSDDWLGDWCFCLPQGSLSEEPYVMVNYMMQQGITTVAVAAERSLIGRQYLEHFQRACDQEGMAILATASIPQIEADDLSARILPLQATGAEALVVLGFGWGVTSMNAALQKLEWSPFKMTNSGFEIIYISDAAFEKIAGWTGIDQYDESNEVGQAFLDRFERRYNRRPEYLIPLYAHDGGRVLAQAFADASPLSRRGVHDALERVKMLPSAMGAPDTRISFGKWQRRGWLGSGYLVVRQITDDASANIFKGRLGPPKIDRER